jgi:hypothetical protein
MGEPSHLISIAEYYSPVDAEIAKGILDEVGINSLIRANNPSGGMDRGISGVELLVSLENAHEASEALHRRHWIN